MSIREQWRSAALQGAPQVFFTPQGQVGHGHCAISLVGGHTEFGPFATPQQHACPGEGCVYFTNCPAQLAVHLNNQHQWDWLTLANKFPPILPEDLYAGLLP